MRAKSLRRAILGVAALLVLPGALLAQSGTGTIDGRVLDQSRAAVPGANVTAKNVATGLSRSAVVSPTGTYRITALPAGSYDLSASLSGFSTQVSKGVVVQVGDTVTVDFAMKVGAVTETVEVTGESPLVQTTTSDVGQVITQEMVENIPLNGRKFQDLSLLVPGTRSSNYYDPTKTEVGGISYGGLTGRSVNINVDGGDNNDGVVRGLLQQFSADAIQEYKVTTQRYSAEFGRSTGGVVNVITKSGTNDLRGTAFVFGRNETLNARDLLRGAGRTPRSSRSASSRSAARSAARSSRTRRTTSSPTSATAATTTRPSSTGGVLPSEEGNFAQPFRNHLADGEDRLPARARSNTPDRPLRARGPEARARLHRRQHAGLAGAINTNMIHSAIAKDTAVIGTGKLNELVVLFQHFENNITAENTTRARDHDAGLHLRRQPQHAAADDPEALADPRRLLVPEAGLGRRPRLQGRGRDDQVALRRVLPADAVRLLQLRELPRRRHSTPTSTASPTPSAARPATTWRTTTGRTWPPTSRTTGSRRRG